MGLQDGFADEGDLEGVRVGILVGRKEGGGDGLVEGGVVVTFLVGCTL